MDWEPVRYHVLTKGPIDPQARRRAHWICLSVAIGLTLCMELVGRVP
jgi:LPS O-antigen subunit length determinant protein (WzzB/FepE family)